MQRDLDRQREERHKMQNEIDVARANTKVLNNYFKILLIKLKAALEEAKRNEIRKDNLDMLVEKMKQRIADNNKLEREINERQKV